MNDNTATTRDRLLAVSRQVFAARGYRGASIRDITRAADANLGAITYHFGTKQKLYEAVLSGAFDEIAQRVEAASRVDGGPAIQLAAVVRALFQFFREAPEVPHLAVHELAAGGGLPAFVGPYLRRNLDTIRRLVEAGIATGQFRQVEPNLVAFSLFSQAIWFAIVGRSVMTIARMPLDHDQMAQRMELHVIDIITRFLAQEAGSP
jgi:AcrR family transcriptional regulator